MFTDPQPVLTATTVATTATGVDLPRLSVSLNYAQYAQADGNLSLTIQHNYGKRVRRVIRLDARKIAADPLLAGVNVEQSMSTYLVVDLPRTGFTATNQLDYVKNLTAYLGDANFTRAARFLGGES